MDIRLDLNKRLLLVNSQAFELDKLEDFILEFWSPLAIAYKIRSIQVKGETLYTFDWARIFAIAMEGCVIIEDFLKQEGRLQVKKKPKQLVQTGLFDQL